MKAAQIDGQVAFDPALFSPEELAMMRDANGATNAVANPDSDEMQAQFVTLAKLIAEGGERERQLRAVINQLIMLAKAGAQQQQSLYAQTQTLAQIVISGSEREVELYDTLQALRDMIVGRAQTLM